MSSEAQPDFSKLNSRQRIAIAEREQVEAATDMDFQNRMAEAHDLFRKKHYLKAIREYEKAQEQRPNNVYPKVKIADIELSMKDTLELLRAKEQEEMQKDLSDRKSEDKSEPARIDETREERLQRMDDWERKEREKREADRKRREAKSEAEVLREDGDVKKLSLEEYQKELAKKYPSGITEDRYEEGNKQIVRRIVVRDGKGNEYKRVEHSWGGVFYFKNADAVTERVWRSETE